MEKGLSLHEPLIVGIKLNISSVICHLKHIAQPKLKVYFLKNALKVINEAIQIYCNFFTNLLIRSNINTD